MRYKGKRIELFPDFGMLPAETENREAYDHRHP